MILCTDEGAWVDPPAAIVSATTQGVPLSVDNSTAGPVELSVGGVITVYPVGATDGFTLAPPGLQEVTCRDGAGEGPVRSAGHVEIVAEGQVWVSPELTCTGSTIGGGSPYASRGREGDPIDLAEQDFGGGSGLEFVRIAYVDSEPAIVGVRRGGDLIARLIYERDERGLWHPGPTLECA